MTTAKQAAANRRNAQKSTGPRTAKGKAIASRNATTHGLLSEELVIRGENPNELTALKQSLQIELQSEGMFEEELVDQITMHFWRLRRIRALESGLLREGIGSDLKDPSASIGPPGSRFFKKKRLFDPCPRATWVTPPDGEGELCDESYPIYESLPKYADHQPNELAKQPHEGIVSQQGYQEDKLRRLGRVFEHSEKILANLQRYRVATERSLHRALHELERIQTARGGGSALAPTILDLQASDVSGQA